MALILMTLALLCGCSKVVVEKYDPATYSDGIRFFRPQPYILVSQTKDDKGNFTGNSISVIYLPDPGQEYVIREEVLLGSISMKPNLTDGWNLVGLETTADSKIPETITALVGAAKLGVAPGARQVPGRDIDESIKPGLYKLVLPAQTDGQPTSIGPVSFPHG
jgi:hypothetical protein